MDIVCPLCLPPMSAIPATGNNTAYGFGDTGQPQTGRPVTAAQSQGDRARRVNEAFKAAGLHRSVCNTQIPESDAIQPSLAHERWLQDEIGLSRPDLANTLLCVGSDKAMPAGSFVAGAKASGQTTWLVKPVHFNLGLDHLVLGADSASPDALIDVAAWLNLLRDALEPGWALRDMTSPDMTSRDGSTYLLLETPAGIDWLAKSSTQASGRSIDRYLPTGRDARAWRRFLNHAQMLLHEHPLNQARLERGQPVINGLWLEGELTPGGQAGELTNGHRFRPVWRTSMGDEALVRALQQVGTASPIVVLDDWIRPAHQADMEAWVKAWADFPQFAKGLMQVFGQKANKQGSLHWHFFGEAGQISLSSSPADRYAFWRRRTLLRNQ